MKVTIITPCYNSAQYIGGTIHSVQQQTISDWELIIVDDGSTDNSTEVVTKIAENDSRIKLIRKENGGSASARNMGLSIAQGEYIQFLDADDTIDSQKLEKQCRIMDELQLDVTYTDHSISYPDGTIDPQIKGYTFNLSKLLMGWGVFGTIPLHAFLYKRSFLQENNILNTSQVKEREDWEFHIKVFSTKPKAQRIKGYCGADYFRCPTGKASSGSITKLKLGTTKYLLYKIKEVRGCKRLLLLLRLALELIDIVLHKVRKKVELSSIMPLFFNCAADCCIFIVSMMLLPIAMGIYVYRIFWTKFHH
ncbi:MAG: glycosyltransferase family 2 protein [Paludibacteraceae bacterium]|nr:glycosyltransferase family 2 protein [Paludibacteraceae bacterium]